MIQINLQLHTWYSCYVYRSYRCVGLQSDILLSSADFTNLHPGIGTCKCHLLWGEFSMCALCCSYSQSFTMKVSRATRYLSLLGEQRRHDMRGLLYTWPVGVKQKYYPGNLYSAGYYIVCLCGYDKFVG